MRDALTLIAFKGLPACGKTTLSRALGRRLAWPVLDKDDILDVLNPDSNAQGPMAYDLLWPVACSRRG